MNDDKKEQSTPIDVQYFMTVLIPAVLTGVTAKGLNYADAVSNAVAQAREMLGALNSMGLIESFSRLPSGELLAISSKAFQAPNISMGVGQVPNTVMGASTNFVKQHPTEDGSAIYRGT